MPVKITVVPPCPWINTRCPGVLDVLVALDEIGLCPCIYRGQVTCLSETGTTVDLEPWLWRALYDQQYRLLTALREVKYLPPGTRYFQLPSMG